jgi:hypothetical protein
MYCCDHPKLLGNVVVVAARGVVVKWWLVVGVNWKAMQERQTMRLIMKNSMLQR